MSKPLTPSQRVTRSRAKRLLGSVRVECILDADSGALLAKLAAIHGSRAKAIAAAIRAIAGNL